MGVQATRGQQQDRRSCGVCHCAVPWGPWASHQQISTQVRHNFLSCLSYCYLGGCVFCFVVRVAVAFTQSQA